MRGIGQKKKLFHNIHLEAEQKVPDANGASLIKHSASKGDINVAQNRMIVKAGRCCKGAGGKGYGR
ncbi:MAG: hypothetical protein ACOXZ0_05145 [Eubacteriales bacterium]|jgi:hypothetical protein